MRAFARSSNCPADEVDPLVPETDQKLRGLESGLALRKADIHVDRLSRQLERLHDWNARALQQPPRLVRLANADQDHGFDPLAKQALDGIFLLERPSIGWSRRRDGSPTAAACCRWPAGSRQRYRSIATTPPHRRSACASRRGGWRRNSARRRAFRLRRRSAFAIAVRPCRACVARARP